MTTPRPRLRRSWRFPPGNVVVADVPERKTDVVAGTYEVELPAGSWAPVAVKITDMLGEEVQVLLPRP
jgi:hypothetical protein